ncbi:MAG: lactate utilization protein [Erysipelotrichaceae bacterium]|nr:lactate utilization protein [Erysipelotrichaceae bacterium]
MDANSKKVIDVQCNRVKQALEKKRFACDVVENAEEARELVKSLIPNGASVGFGGSMTLNETGIKDMIREMDVVYQDRDNPALSREQLHEVLREAFTADVYVTSTNAITLQGELYNVDGLGNRVAAMIFGPKKVIVVAGYNKICKDEETAKKRICMVAAPMNTERLNKDTPCRKVGECCNCNSEQRICDAYVAIKRSHEAGRIHVILVKESYGY